MSTITIDHNFNCLIFIHSDNTKVSFLTNPMFTNTVDGLKSDITNCQTDRLKSKLERFLKDLEAGKFGFMNYEQNIFYNPVNSMYPKIGSELEIQEDDRLNGTWMVSDNNVHTEHTGFWYAAMDISREIQNIKKYIHILSGYLIFAENVDELIRLIKNSTSEKDVLNDLLKRGFTEPQSVAFLECRLTMLTQLEKGQLTEEIDKCNKLIEILKEYA